MLNINCCSYLSTTKLLHHSISNRGVDETLTKASHIKILGRFRNNRKGYAGRIAAIYLVLIVIFLFYNVFMFQLDGERDFCKRQHFPSQPDAPLAQTTEQLSFSNPNLRFSGPKPCYGYGSGHRYQPSYPSR